MGVESDMSVVGSIRPLVRGVESDVSVVGWRHAFRSGWPFIYIYKLFPLLLMLVRDHPCARGPQVTRTTASTLAPWPQVSMRLAFGAEPPPAGGEAPSNFNLAMSM